MVERNNTDAQLIKELEGLKPHDHLCLIYETHQEWEEAIIPFIRIGLERKEKCIYVADTRTTEELRNYLSKAGIAAASFEESGQLTILRESDVYTKEDSFDPDRIINLLITETGKAVRQGYPVLRVTGEMTFVLKGVTGSERLLEYETKLNRDLFPKYPCLAICQYDRWKFDSEIIKGVIMTHPKLIHGNRVSPNFYYIPTEDFLNQKRAELEAQHWLNNIAREEKRKEEMAESEERYRTLFEKTANPILIIDHDGRYIDANKAALKFLYCTLEELVTKDVSSFLPPELGDDQYIENQHRVLWEQGGVIETPYFVNGKMKFLELTITPGTWKNNPAVFGIGTDITERKRKDEEIQHLNLTLRAIRDVNQLIVREKNRKRLLNDLCRILIRTGSYSAAWIALLDQSGKVVGHAQAGLSKKFTPMFKQMKGGELPPCVRQALGQTPAVVTKEPGSACIDCSLSGELKNVRTALTVRLEHAGRVYGLMSAHMLSTSVTDEEIALFQEAAGDMAFALHDIRLLEEKRHAMRSLKEAEARFQDLYDNAPIAYLSMDTTGHIIKANKAACNWLGYSLKEFLGMDRLSIFAEEFQDRARMLFERFKKGDPVENEELIYIRKDRQKVYGLLSFSAIRDDNGRVIASRSVIKDITERKKAEESLRDSEDKFRHVSSITSDIAYSCLSKQGAAYYLDWLSGATKRITGYEVNEIKAQSRWRFLVVDEDMPLFKKNVIGLRPGQTSSCELRLRHKNGEIVWVASYAQCVTDTKSPGYIRLYGGLGDITDRILTEAKISQQNRELKYFASQVPGMLYQFKRMRDGTYSIPFSNDAIKDVFGCTPEDVKESFAPVAKVIVPEDIKGVTDSIEQSARELTPWECEYRVKLPGKGIRTLWGRSVPEAQSDGSIVWYGFNNDITERKQAEEAIKQSEAKYSSLVENSNDGIIIIENGILRFINTKMSEITGFAPEEAVGRKFVDFSPPEEKALLMERHLKRMSGEKVPEIYEATIVSRDGNRILVEVHASNTIYQGHPAVIAIIHDITERKHAEERILLNTRHMQSLLELYRVAEEKTKSISDYMDCMLEASQKSLQSQFAFVGMMNADESVMTIHKWSKGTMEQCATEEKPVHYTIAEAGLWGEVIRQRRPIVVNDYDATLEHKKGYPEGHVPIKRFLSIPVFSGGKIVAVAAVANKVSEYDDSDVDALTSLLNETWNLIERKRSQENFRNSLDNSPLGIRIVNKKGDTLYTNRALLDTYGYDSMEVLNTVPARQRYTPESYAEHKERRRKRERGEFVPDGYIVSIIRKDGEVRYLEVFRKEVLWDNKPETQVLYHDITDRKKAEDDLRQERALFVSGPTVVFKWIAAGGWPIDYVSPNVYGLLGYTAEELMDGKHPFRNMLHPDDVPRIVEANERAEQQKGRRSLSVEYRVVDKKGATQWVHEHTMLVRDDEGAVRYHHGYVTDITEQKKAEAEKWKLERKAQVSSRLASVGEMASGIAHEINNPLTSVVGFSELLMEKDLPEDLRKDLEIIHSGSQRAADIVKRLLTFARQHKPVRNRTNINEIIESTLALRNYALETSNIEVKTMLDAELPWTVADAGQIQQVFLNIIVNAEAEMKKAHGRGRLTIKTEQTGDKIRISFADDGPGIARENLERIFDPFFTTREVGEGTGLGLSLAHGIVAEHNGELYAESEEGKGATFFVDLPVVAEEEKIERVEEVEAAGKAVGGRILVVDDEPIILAFLKQVLVGEGYDVATATSGREALEMIKEQRYNLILSDIKMPGLSGTELYDELGGIAPSLQKRVIFITGDVISVDTREFLKATGAPCVPKPFDITSLKKELKRVITGKAVLP